MLGVFESDQLFVEKMKLKQFVCGKSESSLMT